MRRHEKGGGPGPGNSAFVEIVDQPQGAIFFIVGMSPTWGLPEEP